MKYKTLVFVLLNIMLANSYAEEGSLINIAEKEYEKHLLNESHSGLTKLYAEDSISMFEFKHAIFGKDDLEGFYKSYFESVDITKIDKRSLGRFEMESYVFDYGLITIGWHTEDGLDTGMNTAQLPYEAKYLHVWKKGKDSNSFKLYGELYGSTQYYEPQAMPYAHVAVNEMRKNQYYPETIESALRDEIEYAHEIQLRTVNIADVEGRVDGFLDHAISGRVFKSWLIGKDAMRPELHATYRPENKVYAWHRYYEVLDLDDHIVSFGHFKGGLGEWDTGTRFEGNFISIRERNKDGTNPILFIIANNDRGFKRFATKP